MYQRIFNISKHYMKVEWQPCHTLRAKYLNSVQLKRFNESLNLQISSLVI